MNELRKAMIDQMLLKGFSERSPAYSPARFYAYCHYGYLANRVRVEQLKKIRDWISEDKPVNQKPMQRLMPATTPVEAPMLCPDCKTGRLFLRGVILPEKERRQNVMG